jgi:hypothetical protein
MAAKFKPLTRSQKGMQTLKPIRTANNPQGVGTGGLSVLSGRPPGVAATPAQHAGWMDVRLRANQQRRAPGDFRTTTAPLGVGTGGPTLLGPPGPVIGTMNNPSGVGVNPATYQRPAPAAAPRYDRQGNRIAEPGEIWWDRVETGPGGQKWYVPKPGVRPPGAFGQIQPRYEGQPTGTPGGATVYGPVRRYDAFGEPILSYPTGLTPAGWAHPLLPGPYAGNPEADPWLTPAGARAAWAAHTAGRTGQPGTVAPMPVTVAPAPGAPAPVAPAPVAPAAPSEMPPGPEPPSPVSPTTVPPATVGTGSLQQASLAARSPLGFGSSTTSPYKAAYGPYLTAEQFARGTSAGASRRY